MMLSGKKCILLLLISTAFVAAEKDKSNEIEPRTDLDASSTSAKLFNLGSLFGQYPNYPYGYGTNYQNTYYRPQYPTTGGGYYPSTYYPSTGWTGGQYNPYPNTGNYYPSTGSYYPSSGYYPNTGGTNILGGNGGYGGYGGNGGLRQYSGYLNPEYTGHRNRGFGYFIDTDRYGLPRNWRNGNNYDSYGRDRDRDRDRVPGSYRGYN